jgi:cytidine deaminase
VEDFALERVRKWEPHAAIILGSGLNGVIQEERLTCVSRSCVLYKRMTSDMSIGTNLLEQLKMAARDASRNAYCPYSRFPVGAAVLTKRNEIFSACNVENAAYGSSMCAERSAIFQAVAKGTTKIRAVVVYTPTPHPTPPCGSCRQVINEFGGETEIFSVCDGSEVKHDRLSTLLPQSFGPSNLA